MGERGSHCGGELWEWWREKGAAPVSRLDRHLFHADAVFHPDPWAGIVHTDKVFRPFAGIVHTADVLEDYDEDWTPPIMESVHGNWTMPPDPHHYFYHNANVVPTELTTPFVLHDGHNMPAFGFGTYRIEPGYVTQGAVAEALSLGYVHVDTARVYGNEADVGKVRLRMYDECYFKGGLWARVFVKKIRPLFWIVSHIFFKGFWYIGKIPFPVLTLKDI